MFYNFVIELVDVRYLIFSLFFYQYEQLDERLEEKTEVLSEMMEMLKHREHLDTSIEFIGKLLFGIQSGPSVIRAVRPPGQVLVDDWDCLKRMVTNNPLFLSL